MLRNGKICDTITEVLRCRIFFIKETALWLHSFERKSAGRVENESTCYQCWKLVDKVSAYRHDKRARYGEGNVRPHRHRGGNFKHKVEGREDYKIDIRMANHEEAIKLVTDTLVSPEHGVIKSDERD